MRILNFTERLIKPALQDRSKCTTFRKAWDWLDSKKTRWVEQQECRHKVGALEQLMWMQRGKKECGTCVFRKDNVCLKFSGVPFYPDNISFNCFSKVFGVGKILQTPKVWMRITDVNRNGLLGNSEPFLFIEDEPIPRGQFDRDYIALYDEQKTQKILVEDGFKLYWQDGIDFFKNHYPIIEREWMPFWRIGWDWQKDG